jgi:hypothetical protein
MLSYSRLNLSRLSLFQTLWYRKFPILKAAEWTVLYWNSPKRQ